jgi:hypothetical protein
MENFGLENKGKSALLAFGATHMIEPPKRLVSSRAPGK